MLLGGIEAGGTKMVCAVATEEGRLLERVVIPTGTPENTIPLMLSFFKKWEPAALGIGTFGPVNLDRKSAGYGHIMKTPKTEWAHYDLMGAFREALQIPVGIDTDVNAAVLAEVVWGAARGCSTALYITVGTGVGVGVYCNGGLVHGLVHPEAGHILLSRHPRDQFSGACPFHDNCLEGLASGPALEKRWGRPAGELSDRSEVWELEAYYIGQAVTDYILAYSPQRVVLWGGVMHQPQLFPLVCAQVQKMLGGYVQHELVGQQIDAYIVPPGLGDDPGILGAILLGKQELSNTSETNRYKDIQRLSDNPFLNLYHMDAKDRTGRMFDYYFVSRNGEMDIKAKTHSRRPEGMAVYALWKENPGLLVMLRQFRYPLNDYIYELPAGLLEDGESAAEAAIREMKEETGLTLEIYEGGAEYFRNPFYLAQGFTDESGPIVFGYAAGEIGTEGQEDSEDIAVVLVDKKEAKRILAEERVSVRGAYLLMQFLHADEERSFAFLDEEG